MTAARLGPGAAPWAGADGPPAAASGKRPRRGYASGKADYLSRLAKIEGQVRGLQKMVEADTYYPDVVIQVASVTRALQGVAVGLLTDYLRHCVTQAAQRSPGEGDQALIEAAGAIRQVVRLLVLRARHRACASASPCRYREGMQKRRDADVHGVGPFGGADVHVAPCRTPAGGRAEDCWGTGPG